MNILDFYHKKQSNEKICMVTCYDYTSATLLAKTSIDCILVGDSVAMTMHGFKDTLSATVDMMCSHTAAVRKGADNLFIVSDLPFLSYRKTVAKTIEAVQALMQAGAHAIKLEGAAGNLKIIKHLTESGVPVMGHIGLTPQSIHQLGGYKIQGRTEEGALKLKEEALLLEQAGCFSIVLECIPAEIAREITQALSIPTIGVGAGPYTDGQVLVWQDLLGLNLEFKPKFVKTFMNGFNEIVQGIESYITAVKTCEFPKHEHSY